MDRERERERSINRCSPVRRLAVRRLRVTRAATSLSLSNMYIYL